MPEPIDSEISHPSTTWPPNRQNSKSIRKNAPRTSHIYQYWGYLFKPDKCGTPLLDRLLKGIADTIVSGVELQDCMQLGDFRADDDAVEQEVRA
jgi:hypothetical protein